jgi:hypothetical protein
LHHAPPHLHPRAAEPAVARGLEAKARGAAGRRQHLAERPPRRLAHAQHAARREPEPRATEQRGFAIARRAQRLAERAGPRRIVRARGQLRLRQEAQRRFVWQPHRQRPELGAREPRPAARRPGARELARVPAADRGIDDVHAPPAQRLEIEQGAILTARWAQHAPARREPRAHALGRRPAVERLQKFVDFPRHGPWIGGTIPVLTIERTRVQRRRPGAVPDQQHLAPAPLEAPGRRDSRKASTDHQDRHSAAPLVTLELGSAEATLEL